MKILDLLDTHNSLSISYIEDNKPRSCALWFAVHKGNNPGLLFLSSLETLHGKNLVKPTQVSFTVHKDDQDYMKIRGFQGSGSCQMVDKGNLLNIYNKKFDISNPTLEEVLESSRLYEISIHWLRYIDNSISFGHKEERHFEH